MDGNSSSADTSCAGGAYQRKTGTMRLDIGRAGTPPLKGQDEPPVRSNADWE